MKKLIKILTLTTIFFTTYAHAYSNDMKKYFKDEKIIKNLSPTSFYVTQKNGTERPFVNKYFLHFKPGIYVDIVSKEPLFLSTHKFLSSSGWPSFSKPINKYIVEIADNSHNMQRIEVRSKHADSHLGHVFDDGPISQGGM